MRDFNDLRKSSIFSKFLFSRNFIDFEEISKIPASPRFKTHNFFQLNFNENGFKK